MSYPGSQQQFGLSDLQLLQQRVMLARLHEQQYGQLGEVQPQSPYNSNLSPYGKQPPSGQIPNHNGGMAANASEMFLACNMNEMRRNMSLPMQINSSSPSYLHAQGSMMNPSLQKPDVSYYRAPVTPGRGSLGHYSPQQRDSQNSYFGEIHSVRPAHVPSFDGTLMLRQGMQGDGSLVQGSVEMFSGAIPSRNSPQMQENISMLGYNETHGQPGCTDFQQEQIKQPSDAHVTAKLDPLEEKILFDTEGSGWDSSFSKLAAFDSEEFAGTSSVTEVTYPAPSVQSGSWSALMQSAVSEMPSSDTGVQEELSGLSFQNSELSTDHQPPPNFVTSEKHAKCTDGQLHSSSNNRNTPPCDSFMSSGFPSFLQPGLKLTYQQVGVNTSTSDTTIEQQAVLPQSSKCQQQFMQYASVGHLESVGVDQKQQNIRSDTQIQNSSLHETYSDVDEFQWNRSPLLKSGFNKNIRESIQQQMNGSGCMPVADCTSDQKDKGYNSCHSPMDDGPKKNAAQAYESQSCHRGENSSDSYNSKVSPTYAAQPDYACLNAEDSESSARSSQKSPNQTLCVSSPGAVSQQECVSSLKSMPYGHCTDFQGQPNPSADSIVKGSSISHIRATLDSQQTSESNRVMQPRDYESSTQFGSAMNQTEFHKLGAPIATTSEGKSIPYKFSFQSSVLGEDVCHAKLGHQQKGQTWWAPSSFGHSVPPQQEASLEHNWGQKSGILGNSGFGVLNSVGSSHGAFFSGPVHVENQLNGKTSSNVSAASEFCTGTGQQISLAGFNQGNLGTSSFQYSNSRTTPTTQSFNSETNQLCLKPQNVWMNMSSKRDATTVTCKASSNMDSPSISSYLCGKDQSSLANPSSQNAQLSLGGKEMVDNKRPQDQTSPVIQGGESHESVGKCPMLSGEVSICLASSTNQQEYTKTEQSNMSSMGTSSESLQVCDQTRPYSSTDNIRHEVGISTPANMKEADMGKVDPKSSLPISNLNVHSPDVLWQQRMHSVQRLTSSVNGQFNAASLIGSRLPSGTKSSMESAKSLSAMQYINSSDMPVFGQNNTRSHSYINRMAYDRSRNINIRAPLAPASYKQYEHVNNRQMLSLSDAPVTHNGIESGKDSHIRPNLCNQIVTNDQVLSSSVFPADASHMGRALSIPKKRKFATYECLPWHEQVMQTCRELPDISLAERQWAETMNRLIEKRLDNGDRIEDIQPAGRAKKRLILTTQVMQQVFQPPRATVSSVDAASEYEIMAYFVAKFALADSCSLMNKQTTDHRISCDIGAACPKNVWSRGDCSLVTAAGELVGRVKKLENYIDGLHKSFSVVDVRLECQELEKVGVINHFAKYHSRVTPSTEVDSPSSSTAVRPFLQRYVTAVPLPQKLPEGAQCHSL